MVQQVTHFHVMRLDVAAAEVVVGKYHRKYHKSKTCLNIDKMI